MPDSRVVRVENLERIPDTRVHEFAAFLDDREAFLGQQVEFDKTDLLAGFMISSNGEDCLALLALLGGAILDRSVFANRFVGHDNSSGVDG